MSDLIRLIQTGFIGTVFLDFDDSICIHDKPVNWKDKSWEKDRKWRFRKCMEGDTYYIDRHDSGDCQVLPGIIRFVAMCNYYNVKVYCLSTSECSIYLRAKKKYLDSIFPEGSFEDLIGVCSNEAKIEFLKLYLETQDKKKDIVFIDDSLDNRREADFLPGCRVFSPMNLCVEMSRRP